MHLIEADHWHALIEHVTAVDPELVTVCRWLACGPQMAPLVLGQDVHSPSPTEVQRLIGALDTAPPEAAAAGHALLAERSRGLAEVEVALGRLIEAGEAEWSHPTEILGRPCPDFAELLDVCRNRLQGETGERRRHLETVRAKLERAAKLEARARQRRSGTDSGPLSPWGRGLG